MKERVVFVVVGLFVLAVLLNAGIYASEQAESLAGFIAYFLSSILQSLYRCAISMGMIPLLLLVDPEEVVDHLHEFPGMVFDSLAGALSD